MRRDVVWASAVAGLAAAASGAPLVADAGTVSYVYDGQGRVVCAGYTDGTLVEYAYDGAGNRTSYIVTTGSACPALPPNPPPPPPPPPPPSVHVSPNPAWGHIVGNVPSGSITRCDAALSLQGITLPITLQLTASPGSLGTLAYSKNGGGQTVWTDGATLGMTSADTLLFCATQTGNGEASGDITVTNQTDFNTVLDTVTYDLIVGTPP
jgi:hypothetical protein